MKRVIFTEGIGRGQWQRINTVNGKGGAKFICPECGHEREINSHIINPVGDVNPSVVCSCGCGCKFHEYVILKGWGEKKPETEGD